MKLAKYQGQNTVIIFILALLLALGIGYRFNSTIDDHDAAGHPIETFDYR